MNMKFELPFAKTDKSKGSDTNLTKHTYIKLIEFSLENKHFTANQACEASNISPHELSKVKNYIFSFDDNDEPGKHPSQNYQWNLSPEAYFNYLQFCEYQHAIKTANKAHDIASKAFYVSIAIGSIGLLLALVA